MSFISKAFHLLMFSALSYGFYYDLQYTTSPLESKDHVIRTTAGGRFKYLTVINYVILQLGYFGFCVLNDLFGSNLKTNIGRSSIQVFRDWLFTTITVPITTLVCFLFWGLYLIDRNLIYPEANDLWFPKWLNHFYHTLPIVSVITELFLVYHTMQKGIAKYLPLIICTGAYISMLYYINSTLNFWVYPVFEVLKYPVREAVMAAMIAPAFLFLNLGEKIHRYFWNISKNQHLPLKNPTARTKTKKRN